MSDTERTAYLERQVAGLLELVEILSKRIDQREFDVVATTALSTCSISSRAWRTLGCWRWQQFSAFRTTVVRRCIGTTASERPPC